MTLFQYSNLDGCRGLCSDRFGCKNFTFFAGRLTTLITSYISKSGRQWTDSLRSSSRLSILIFIGEFLSRSAPAISRTIAGIGLTDVLLVVGGFIALDILFTLGLVFFTTAGGKRSSSQSGFFGWGLPSFSGLYRNVSHMYNR